MPSSTVENYLKQLYLEQQAQASMSLLVPMGRLAAAMGVVPGTATTMIKSLADAGLVSYEPREGARLTRGGEQLALRVLRRHRLIELFLVKIVGLDWSEVHDEAEELEHAISDKVLEKIDALLGRPSVDPHGDPIPPAKGKLTLARTSVSLLDCPIGELLRVTRVLDQNPAFLQFVERSNLTPDSIATVTARDAQQSAVTVRIGSGASTTLGFDAAGKIRVARCEAVAKVRS